MEKKRSTKAKVEVEVEAEAEKGEDEDLGSLISSFRSVFLQF